MRTPAKSIHKFNHNYSTVARFVVHIFYILTDIYRQITNLNEPDACFGESFFECGENDCENGRRRMIRGIMPHLRTACSLRYNA